VRSQAGYRETCEVLTDTAPQGQHIAQRRGDGRRLRIECEVGVNATHQVLDGLEQRAAWCKRRMRITGDRIAH
jgi:hypothetical protein